MSAKNVATQLVYLVAGVETQMKLFKVTNRLVGHDNDHPMVANGWHTGMVDYLYQYAEIVDKYLDAQKHQDFSWRV